MEQPRRTQLSTGEGDKGSLASRIARVELALDMHIASEEMFQSQIMAKMDTLHQEIHTLSALSATARGWFLGFAFSGSILALAFSEPGISFLRHLFQPGHP